jgi:hypothetical protein
MTTAVACLRKMKEILKDIHFFSSYRGPTRSTGTPSLIATSSTVSDSGENIVKRFASAQTVTG